MQSGLERLRAVVTMAIVAAGCASPSPESVVAPSGHWVVDTARLRAHVSTFRCAEELAPTYCFTDSSVSADAGVSHWNLSIAGTAADSTLPAFNGVPLWATHGQHGPYAYVLPRPYDSVVRCDDRYNVFDVPAFAGMPAIHDSISIGGAFRLIAPRNGDTVSRDGFVIRWSEISPEAEIWISLHNLSRDSLFRSLPGDAEWSVAAADGALVVSSGALASFLGSHPYLMHVVALRRNVRTAAGRPYELLCTCSETSIVWLE